MKSKKFQFKKGFKTESENKSVQLREQLGLKPYDPLPAKLLAEKLGIIILTPKDVPGMTSEQLKILAKSKEWSAVTIGLPNNKFLIIHNEKHSLARQESDLMHEMAHIICKHPFTGIQLSESISLRNYDETHEKEAEWLGGCLQLCREALVWALSRKMKADDIANHFNSSALMVKYRINATGVRYQIKYFDPFS